LSGNDLSTIFCHYVQHARRTHVDLATGQSDPHANLESGLEIIMAQLARQKGDLARAALGIIFATSVVATLLVWFIAHP
jgi:hypothetical protein